MIIELIFAAALSLPSEMQDAADLPERYRVWLEEEAVYIISDRERRIFRRLTSNSQRDRFIEEFWEQRDPTPGTEANEFRDEHYERIEYANNWLGRETRRPGWSTDRGRIYILLGPPREIRRYHSSQSLVPLEMWFYEADPRLGVPPFFYQIFFKKFGVGDFVQYDPTIHGPQALIFLSAGHGGAFEGAAQEIYWVDPELAQASINLVPTEMADIETQVRPTLSSITLISQIDNIPNYRRDASYAERILRGEPRVETHYAFSPDQLAADFHVIKLGTGDSLLNYAFYFPAPSLDYGQFDNTLYTALEVLLSATTPEGEVIASRQRIIEQEIEPDQVNAFRRGGIAFEGHLPLLPGRYNLALTVRNRITRVFYSAQEEIEIPGFVSRELGVLKPILFDRSESGTFIRPNSIPPYAYLALKFHPLLRDDVVRGQEIGVFMQVTAPPGEAGGPDPVEINYRLLLTGEGEEAGVVSEGSRSLDPGQFDATGTATVIWKFGTAELALGSYRLEIDAARGEESARAAARTFEVTSEGGIEEPLTSYGPPIDFTGPEPVIDRGNQLLNLGEAEVAVTLLERARTQWPADNELAALCADALVATGSLEEAIGILLEVALRDPTQPRWKRELSLLYLRTGNYNRAIGFLEQVRLQEGDSIEVLNPLGEAYYFAENIERANEVWERSLAIEPDQPLISRRLRELRGESDTRDNPDGG